MIQINTNNHKRRRRKMVPEVQHSWSYRLHSSESEQVSG